MRIKGCFVVCLMAFSGCVVGESYQVPGDDSFEYVEQDDMVIPVSGDPTFNAATPGRGPEVVFLNFDGVTLRQGGWAKDNAQTNVSFIVRTASGTATVPAFDHSAWGSDRSQVINGIVSALGQRFAGYSVRFTSVRPASGEYTMIVMGGRPGVVGKEDNVLGTAPLDPQNYNNSDIGFVFTENSAEFGYSVQGVADTTAHEIGHSVGLNHIDRDGDVMHPASCQCDQSWGAGPVYGSTDKYQDDRALLQVAFPAPLASQRDGVLCGGARSFVHAIRPGWTLAQMQMVGRMYCGLLDRAPDAGGFAYHTDRLVAGNSPAQTAGVFLASPEFAGRYGVLSNRQFVSLLYQVAFDREPDAGGLASWEDALNRGLSRPDLAMYFLDSQEARNRLNPIFDFR